MKIAVSGKGGVGKTLVAGALAYYFVGKDYKVLAIDADPSPNLALTLGIPLEKANKIVPVSENRELIESKTQTGFSGVYRLTFSVDDIIRDFSVESPYGMNLLLMGTVKSVGGGCTCPANAIVRELLRHLVVERDEVVVMDMEAGIEHLSRGTTRAVDMLIIVVEPGRRSIETAQTIIGLAKDLGVENIALVANKIHNESDKEFIRSAFPDVEVLGHISYDPAINEADLANRSLFTASRRTSEEVKVIYDKLISRNRQKVTKE